MHLSRTCKSQAPLLPSGDSPLRRRDVERKARRASVWAAASNAMNRILAEAGIMNRRGYNERAGAIALEAYDKEARA